jgi:hypothetical protein
MILTITIIIFLFIIYYLLCQNHIEFNYKLIYLFFFIIFSIILRINIPTELNKDFAGYAELYNFENPENLVSFLISEPYLYILYKFFELFTLNKRIIIESIYWFNLFISLYFYIWLAFRKDVNLWKKVVIFVLYYFLSSYVVLRNAPVYFIYSYFFYYGFRSLKYKKIIFTPLMHVSSLPLLLLIFYKSKRYYKYLFSALVIFIPILIIIVLPIIDNVEAIRSSLDKADSYAEGMTEIGIFHKIYFCFISVIFIVSWINYKEKVFHPLIITTFIIYYISYFINPVIGFRFSPYVIFTILLNNFKSNYNLPIITKVMNLVTILLLPYFIFTFIDTHYL